MKHLLKNHTLLLTLFVGLALVVRVVWLTSIPPSLYWDEASIAYNAFSIVTNGTDEYLNPWPMTHFLAYGDAKPPLYIYATALFLGLGFPVEWAVRLPSALSGTLIVGLLYPLMYMLLRHSKEKRAIALTAVAIAAVSPWLIVMSRAGFEANLALALLMVGLLAFFKGLHSHALAWWLLASTSLIATLYTFNAYRIFLPFLLLLLLGCYWRMLRNRWKAVLVSLLWASILVAPLVPFVTSFQARVRFDEVSVFKDQDPVLIANQRIEANDNALWARVVYNRRLQYLWHMLRHYLDHLDPYYLFLGGDVNPRLSTKESGILYLTDLVALGLAVSVITKHRVLGLLLIGWIAAGLVPAGMARETPHALRSLQSAPAVILLLALGYHKLRQKPIYWKWLVAVVFVLQSSLVWHSYFRFYRLTWADSWQYGYKQLSAELEGRKEAYDHIYVTKSVGRPHTYLALYGKYHPSDYYQTAEIAGDPLGLIEVHGFGPFTFGDPPNEKPADARWLVVSRPDGVSDAIEPLFTISNPQGQPVFVGFER